MSKTSNLRRDINKYLDYFFQSKGFTSDNQLGQISPQAIETAKTIRGDRGPAIIIQGVMPRSGTVYVGELLRRHPDLFAYAHELWEMPALLLTPDIRALQNKFLQNYRINKGRLGDDDFLPLFGAALVAYLQQPAAPQQRILAKMPGVQYLSQFYAMFPHENLLILVRDGRDLVHSTLRTWPKLNFIQVCLRWNRSARAIIHTVDYLDSSNHTGYWLAKFEDALRDPINFVTAACEHFDLDRQRYPFEQIDGIRVIGSSKLANQEGEVTWKSHYERPDDFTPLEYWKEWSGVKKKIFKRIAGKSLMDLGYCENLDW